MPYAFWLYGSLQNCACPPAPANTSPHAWIQPTVGICQIVVTILLAFILWRLSFIVFVKNAEQKITEREAAWYHKVVVDPQLKSLTDFFTDADRVLVLGAETCERAKSNDRAAEMETAAGKAIKEFNELLLPAQRSLSDTVNCFSNDLGIETRQLFEQLQDQVTGWFEELRESRPVDSRQSLPALLSGCQNQIITRLRAFEFRTFGFQHPGLFRSLFWW